MKYTVDRIEEGIAVCEDENENIVNFDLRDLPKGIKDGDIFKHEDDEFTVCRGETEDRRSEIAKLQTDIFEKKNRR